VSVLYLHMSFLYNLPAELPSCLVPRCGQPLNSQNVTEHYKLRYFTDYDRRNNIEWNVWQIERSVCARNVGSTGKLSWLESEE